MPPNCWPLLKANYEFDTGANLSLGFFSSYLPNLRNSRFLMSEVW
jgi:hypothetical protein